MEGVKQSLKGPSILPRLWIAAIIVAVAALAVAPAAQADVTTTNITSWTSNSPGTPPNSPYLISYDNQPTTLAVTGTAPGAGGSDTVDIRVLLRLEVSVQDPGHQTWGWSGWANGAFTTATGASAPQLRTIAGHDCRLRAVPHNRESTGDSSAFADSRGRGRRDGAASDDLGWAQQGHRL